MTIPCPPHNSRHPVSLGSSIRLLHNPDPPPQSPSHTAPNHNRPKIPVSIHQILPTKIIEEKSLSTLPTKTYPSHPLPLNPYSSLKQLTHPPSQSQQISTIPYSIHPTYLPTSPSPSPSANLSSPTPSLNIPIIIISTIPPTLYTKTSKGGQRKTNKPSSKIHVAYRTKPQISTKASKNPHLIFHPDGVFS